MTTTINASTSSGLVNTADTSGIIKVQSNGVTTNAIAWCNFNGTLTSPITPRASYNVSTVTKSSTGNFTVNFINALSDANYCAIAGCDYDGVASFINVKTLTTTNCFVQTVLTNYSAYSDHSLNYIAIFGN